MLTSAGLGSSIDYTARTVTAQRDTTSGVKTLIINMPGEAGRRAVRTFGQRSDLDWIISQESALDLARLRGMLADLDPDGTNPFSALDEDYLGRSDGRTVWVSLAWVAYGQCELKEAGACDPSKTWTHCDGKTEILHCIEKTGDESYTVHMKAGHGGFHMPSTGLHTDRADNDVDRQSYYAALTSAEVRDDLATRYLLTALDNGRQVGFKLYSRDGKLIGEAPADRARPVMARASERGEPTKYNTCGGSGRACPQFYVPDDMGRVLDTSFVLEQAGN